MEDLHPRRSIRVHPADNVAVALVGLEGGEHLEGATIREDVATGHKFALRAIDEGEDVIKYGSPIGFATSMIPRGAWVHEHNLATHLSGRVDYRYEPVAAPERREPFGSATFEGYRRRDGCVGTRNEIWIVNTVGCVNRSAERIAAAANEQHAGAIDGVFAFPHPYGCSQLGDDLERTRRVLAGLVRHPNAGGVLVLGLGCEDNQLDDVVAAAGDVERGRLRYLNAQDVMDEVEAGEAAVAELVKIAAQDRRTSCPLADLVLGMNCGGSDAFSGLTANPLVGRITDRVTSAGGTTILTEVPEMFGAEQFLMNRARDEHVFGDLVDLIDGFKDYFRRHGQPIYENPSPGNRDGGITTLEEKSLGAIQKGGHATVTQVLSYADPVEETGLVLLEAPGNDGVSATAQVVSGATIILFTTGRGTPLGFPVPTLKLSTNTALAQKKPRWIDFDAGRILSEPASLDKMEEELVQKICRVASGYERARNEVNGYREIAIWKGGVTV